MFFVSLAFVSVLYEFITINARIHEWKKRPEKMSFSIIKDETRTKGTLRVGLCWCRRWDLSLMEMLLAFLIKNSRQQFVVLKISSVSLSLEWTIFFLEEFLNWIFCLKDVKKLHVKYPSLRLISSSSPKHQTMMKRSNPSTAKAIIFSSPFSEILHLIDNAKCLIIYCKASISTHTQTVPVVQFNSLPSTMIKISNS